MPRSPDWLEEGTPERPGSRFSLAPAIAIGVPEEDWGGINAEDAVRRHFGSWTLDEEHPPLGRATARDGSVGRGAEGWAAVLEFVTIHGAGGVISAAAAYAFKRVWERIRARTQRPEPGSAVWGLVSRGGAVALAVAAAADRFAEVDDLSLEAAEEPSTIAGHDTLELSYVGAEPWIVLLRNRPRRLRYVVVVAPNGEILGALRTEVTEVEAFFDGSLELE